MAKAARFPLELFVIAAVGLFNYGRALSDCSSSSTARPGSTSAAGAGGSTSAGRWFRR